jgi:hypothetical protein
MLSLFADDPKPIVSVFELRRDAERAEHREILIWCRQEPRAMLFLCLLWVPADSAQVKSHSSRTRTNHCTTRVCSHTFRISRKHSVVNARLARGRSSNDCGRRDVIPGHRPPRETTFPRHCPERPAPTQPLWGADNASRSLRKAKRNMRGSVRLLNAPHPRIAAANNELPRACGIPHLAELCLQPAPESLQTGFPVPARCSCSFSVKRFISH